MKTMLFLLAAILSSPLGLVWGEQPPGSQYANEFLVIAYSAPPSNYSNIERYREIANAGFDAIVPGMGAWDHESHSQVLDLAEKVGLRVIICDPPILFWHKDNRKIIDQSLIDVVTTDCRDHSALLGYFICDEPHAGCFEGLATTSRRMHLADPEHLHLTNLFPGYASPAQLGVEDYREYVHSFIQAVKPQVLSYDHYPLRNPGLADTGWYDDLKVIRDESRQAGIPFWIYLQSEGMEGLLRIPTRSEVFWQVGTVLAYGARSVYWFTYWTPPPMQDFPADLPVEHQLIERHVGGMISYDGRRTPMYDAVREANLFLRKAGRELIGWDNKFISHYENGELMDGSQSTCLTPVGADTKLVVGTFVRGDRRRVVIANDSYAKSAAITIKPKGNWQPSTVIVSLEARHKSSGEDLSQWQLGPGGCLVIECQQSVSPSTDRR